MDLLKKPYFSVILIISVGLAIYANSLNGEFQFDDKQYFVFNHAIQDLGDFKAMWGFYKSRIVALLTFALNFHFHRYEVFGYHLTNLVIHITNALLVWWLVQLILRTPIGREQKQASQADIFSLAVALIFLCHPLQTQAVSYITQRIASLATLFYLATFCFFLKARLGQQGMKEGGGWYVLCIITALLGAFTKEITFTLPFMLYLGHKFFFFSPSPREQKKKDSKRYIIFIVLIFFCLMFPAFFNFNFAETFNTTMSHSFDGDIVSFWNYPLTQLRVVSRYISLFVIPIRQNFDYVFPSSHSLFELETFTGFVILGLIMSLAVLLRRRYPLISFGIFWYFIAASVESSFIPIRNVIFEHRTYLPSFGLCLAVCTILFYVLKKPRTFLIVIILLSTGLSFLTIQRNRIWQTEIALWQDCLEKSPEKVRPYKNLIVAYLERGQIQQALVIFDRFLQRGMRDEGVFTDLGILLSSKGDLENAKKYLLEALTMNPTYMNALNALGIVVLKENNEKFAETLFIRAVKGDYYKLIPAINLANLWQSQGKEDKAFNLYRELYLRNRDLRKKYYFDSNRENLNKVFYNLGEQYFQRGMFVQSLHMGKEGRKYFPEDQRFQELIHLSRENIEK